MRRVFNFITLVYCSWIAVSSISCRFLEQGGGDVISVLREEDSARDWDSLIFTVQWPVTTCLEWKEKVANHTCILPDDGHLWTIHGLWPTKLGTMGPAFCNDSWVFDLTKVKNLMPELMKLWPNIHGGDTIDSLWKHEWSKHGTCAALHPKFSTEALYFDYSLNLAEKYRVQDILREKNIIPSLQTTYQAQDIWKVVKNGIGKNPAISCESDKKTGNYYISEIKLCFTPDLQLTNCEGETVFLMDPKIKRRKSSAALLLGNCPSKKRVYYPGPGSFRTKSKKN